MFPNKQMILISQIHRVTFLHLSDTYSDLFALDIQPREDPG
jgi:hypothetical protein